MTREQLQHWIEAQTSEELRLADGFEDAFVGVVYQFHRPLACYDRARCLQILQTRDDMSEEDAEEFFAFNVEGAWVGDQTPVFLVRPEP